MTVDELTQDIRFSLNNPYNAHHLREGKIGYPSSTLNRQESSFSVFTNNREFKVTVEYVGEWNPTNEGL